MLAGLEGAGFAAWGLRSATWYWLSCAELDCPYLKYCSLDMPVEIGNHASVARLVSLGFIAAACLVVGCDSGRVATPASSGVVEFEPTTTDSGQSDIAAMMDRLAGHTVSYRMELQSPAFTGVWNIVEREGNIIEVEYLGDAEPHEEKPWLVLSEALRIAADADQTVVLANESETSIRLTVDSDINSVDDEFMVYASDITVVS